jgi:hypothetical protein
MLFIIYLLKAALFGLPFLFMYWVFTSQIIIAVSVYVVIVVIAYFIMDLE